jgi:hypothetical protein
MADHKCSPVGIQLVSENRSKLTHLRLTDIVGRHKKRGSSIIIR